MYKKNDNLPEFKLRDDFSDDLKGLFEPPDADWTATDRAVMDRAHQVLLPRRRRRWGYWQAAAAVLLIGAGLVLMQFNPEKPAGPMAAREDVDGSGRVDILDAFRLAKAVQADAAPEGQWDMNGDGAVNQQDVDIVAQAAVAVRKEML